MTENEERALGLALAKIAADLSETQRALLVEVWRRARALEEDPVPVTGPVQTVSALVKHRLAWEPGGTLHQAELTELGMAVAAQLSFRRP